MNFFKSYFFIAYFLASPRLKSSELLYPASENIALFKPVYVSPQGSTCGLEYKDTLCDNRFTDDKSCSSPERIFFCDQTCPHGNTIQNLNQLDQLKLDTMNPCVIFKDFGYILNQNGLSKNSFYFDKTNNLCTMNSRPWKPFALSTSRSRPKLTYSSPRTSDLDILQSGFSLSLWFTQSGSNNGTIVSLVQDDNSPILSLTIQTMTKKLYIKHFCLLKSDLFPFKEIEKECFLEVNLPKLAKKENFFAIRIHQKSLDLFVNEPSDFDQDLSVASIDLSYDLGSYIVNKSEEINFFVGIDFRGENKFYGWIQDLRVFTISLVNAEMSDLFGVNSNEVRIQPQCRCANAYPRNQNRNSTICLKNKFNKLDQLDTETRLNQFAHPLNYANDDNFRTSWISCILTSTNPIELVLDLENGVYLVQRIEVFFANLPPTRVVIQRFYENQWFEVQRFSIDCDGSDPACGQIPAEFESGFFGGFPIIWSTLIDQEKTFFSDSNLVDSIRASKIKLIMSGYFPGVKNDIRKLYYAINELRVRGRCDCNGYSANCDMTKIPFECKCDQASFTDGNMCEKCLSLFNNRPYETRYSNPFASCSECNCNNRSNSCAYSAPLRKGLCQNCAQNSTGPSCERCIPNFFFDPSTKKCEQCKCDLRGVITQIGPVSLSYCNQISGNCICKQNVMGTQCDQCKPGFFNLTIDKINGCEQCECNYGATQLVPGTNLTLCEQKTGQCLCESAFVSGFRCDRCIESMYDLQNGCNKQCNCDPLGSLSAACDQITGQCNCRSRVRGLRCNQCDPGYYNLTIKGCANKCQCDQEGSLSGNVCDIVSGRCLCKTGYKGQNCDRCRNGYWRSGSECVKCECNLSGILDEDNICEEATGKCICNELSEGFECDRCKPGFYGLNDFSSNCTKCACDPIGTNKSTLIDGNYICDARTSQCACNINRIGVRCETCANGFFFLNLNDIDCFECACDPAGSIPGSNCDSLTGECVCKIANGIGGTRCDQCTDGFFNFSKTTGSCSRCGCNVAGSFDQDCDQFTGQCNCKEFVTGLKCNVCIPGTSNLDVDNPFGCSKLPSKQSPPFLSVKNSDTVTVSWSKPDYPNGIIRFYLVYRNETLVTNTSTQNYDDTNLLPFVVYSYRIESFNDQGSTSSRSQNIKITLPSQPCCNFTYQLFNIRSSQVQVLWTVPERLNGLSPFYSIKVYSKKDPNLPSNPIGLDNLIEQTNSSLILDHTQSNTDLLQTTITNLNAYSHYFLHLQACNRDLNSPDTLYCLDGQPQAHSASAYTSFITSQDRPQNQTQPVLISLNSSFIIMGVRRPLKPNGIIVMYEIYKKSYNSTDQDYSLACVIEEFYDPNDSMADNKLKICIIKNLRPRSTYAIVATSSTVIGRSRPSAELVLTTLENVPICPPLIQSAISPKYDSVFIKWLPSYQQTLLDNYWINCLGGGISNFSVYLVNTEQPSLVYTGLENSLNLTKLNSSQTYNFYVQLCNKAGCLRTETFSIKTVDPPPNKWTLGDLTYQVVDSALRFDWSQYRPYNSTNFTGIKYRLERAKISFANPPPLLEQGYRLHGFNYFKFDSSKYYPQGYPFFGLKYKFKTQHDGLIYLASSGYSQSEFSAVQVNMDTNWFLSDTQSQVDACSIYLQGDTNNRKWNAAQVFRLNSYAFMRSNEKFAQVNSTRCTKQVISDVIGIYVGGLPDDFLSRDESAFFDQQFKKIQPYRFLGCLKNLTTIIHFDTIKFSSNWTIPVSREIELNFSEAAISPGEPRNSNTIYGCPLNLDTESRPVHVLGFGYIFSNIGATVPVEKDSNEKFTLNLHYRTEWPTGILFLNFDIENEQYILVRLLDTNKIEICFKTRIRYDLTNSNAFLNYFDLLFNESYGINSLANGYWSSLNLELNFKNRSLLLQLNQTRIVSKNFFTQESFPKNLDPKILNATLLFTFYFNTQFFTAGFDFEMLTDIYALLARSFINPVTREHFSNFFSFIEFLDECVYFTGCIKLVKINGYLVDFFDLKNLIAYKNSRFDGCANVNVFVENVSRLKDVLMETNESVALDAEFGAFTEYFYRVTAFNNQGSSSSEWLLVRTPEDKPQGFVDIERFLRAKAISGYHIQVDQMSNFCFYCTNWSFMTKGFVTRFVLKVLGAESVRNYDFYCETVCSNEYSSSENMSQIESVFGKIEDPRAQRLLVSSTPITVYSLVVSVCTNAGCIDSQMFNITTLGEVPDGIKDPTLSSSTSSSLSLTWDVPAYPSGNITAYIIRLIEANAENVVYFGLQRSFFAIDLHPLTTYSFVLEVCNAIGCGRSEKVSFTTKEMAPLFVPVPTVLKVTQTVLIIKWSKPTNDQIQNGFLTNYILYLNDTEYFYNVTSFNISTCAECASNIKDLNNLIPGALYEITLSACTKGGCTNSSVLSVRTLESDPDTSDIKIELVEISFNFLVLNWTRPSRPNGLFRRNALFMNDKLVYEGNSTKFKIENLLPNTFYYFYVQFCNFFSCNSSLPARFRTDETAPKGSLVLEAQAKGSNQIELKWYSSPVKQLKPNGNILYSVFVTGPFLVDSDIKNLYKIYKNRLDIVQKMSVNLLNTTVMNTKYGILDRILPNSHYEIQINASNSKGFVLSNKVNVQTFKSGPDYLPAPELVYSNSTCLKVEWSPPLLANSEDLLFSYELIYRKKMVWSESGPIEQPAYDDHIISLFSNKVLASFYILTNLSAFTAFSFRLTAANFYGQTSSEWSQDFYTQETRPEDQAPVTVANLTSTSVYVKFTQASQPNGFISLFKINVFKHMDDELVHIGVVSVDNTTIAYNITHLEPFTQYLFVIESCNSIGCAQSPFDKFHLANNNYTRTLPALPQSQPPPVLASLNSFTVQVTWSPPSKINGILKHYVLERIDFKSLLQTSTLRKYKFSALKRKFLDDTDIQPCGLYSYRMFSFNQVGSTVSSYVNITVSSSRPLIVSPPVISLINSSSARFEWSEPITLCNLTKYSLELKSSVQSLSIDADASVRTLLVTNLTAFTVYKSTLVACVSPTSDSCSNSLTRNFRTPGDMPGGLGRPVVKMLSPKAVSVEWLEPQFRNGEYLSYQVIRQNVHLNRTENLYSGEQLYYLDMDIEASSYRYRVIYINEFGSAISEWSSVVRIESSVSDLTDNKLRYNFNLELTCPTANLAFVKWNIRKNEILFYLKKLFSSTLLHYEKFYIELNEDRVERQDFFALSESLVFLNESRDYTISLVIKIQTDSSHVYYLSSEQRSCRTQSLKETYDDTQVDLQRSDNELIVLYRLADLLVRFYDRFAFVLEYKDKLLDVKQVSQKSGQIVLAPVLNNEVYLVKLRVCRQDGCIEFEPKIYSFSTLPPQGLSELSLTLSGPTSVRVSWQEVSKPNGYEIKYLVFRRLACISFNLLPDCPIGKVCCGPNTFNPIPGYKCCSNYYYIPLGENEICCASSSDVSYNIGHGNDCCGDMPYYNTSTQFCCNSEIKNELANRVQQCPVFPPLPRPCQQYQLVSTQNLTVYSDLMLNASTLYEYSLCVQNSFGQTCSTQMHTIRTQVTRPQFFSQFNSQPIAANSFLLSWHPPLKPNDFTLHFILSRNSREIYRGKSLQFEDKSVQPDQKYIYSIKACNSAGCVDNLNKIILSPNFARSPAPIQCIQVLKSSSAITLKWSLPDPVQKLVLTMPHIDLETEFYFSFESNLTHSTIPSQGPSQPVLLSSNVFIQPNSSLSASVINLRPSTRYQFQLVACNEHGCSEPTVGHVTTHADKVSDFKKPFLYALNESVVEILWWQPELNGLLAFYKIYRDDMLVATLRDPGTQFYVYQDTGLEANKLYTYVIEASNGAFALESQPVQIRTPVDSAFSKCNNKTLNASDSIYLLNILKVSLAKVSDTYLTLSYENGEWKNLLVCVQPSASFWIKILLLSKQKGGQSVEFTYPDLTKAVTSFNITGLTANTNYSIRLAINSNYPHNKAVTSAGVFVRTKSPPVTFDSVFYAIKNHSNQVSIRWRVNNAIVDKYHIVWTKLNCTNRILENMTIDGIQRAGNFFFFNSDIRDEFIFNSVRVVAVNERGASHSPELNFTTRGSRPMPVFDLRTIQVFSTGLKIRFKNKNFYLSHFAVLLEPVYFKLNKSVVIVPVETECRVNSSYETVVSGLGPYTMYNVTVRAVSFSGFESESEEFLLVNTLESTPRYLRRLHFESFGHKILVKFSEPGQLNGILTKFNLYMNTKLVFSGRDRDFVCTNLQPFTNYSFGYEACTNMGCSRYKGEIVVQTEQSYPTGLEAPNVIKENGCFVLEIKLPLRMNGMYRYGEIYRKSKKFASEHTEEILVKNFTLPTPFIDCLLTPNVLYSYRSVIYNAVGSVSSEYTKLVPIDLLKPENFKQMAASQINETLIRLTFTKPSTYSQHVTYKIYRDSNLIATLYEQTSDLLSYDDFFVFAPDQYLKYNVFACNQIGCSSDDKFSVFVKTRNLPPVLVYKPILLDLGSDYIKIDASLSVVLRVNQKIAEYRYFLNNVMSLATTEPVVLVKNLKPNTQYLINLEVCTFLGPGCLKSSDYLEVQTLQVLPVIDFDPTCSPGMRNLTIEWPTSSQQIDNYVLKYRFEQEQYSNLVVKDKNWVHIDKLKPFSEYEIVLGGCNRAGCSYSQSFVCKTTGKPSNVTIQAETTADGFLLAWNIDNDFKDQDFEFKLSRSVLNQPILYDQKFRPIRLQDKVVYAGTGFRYEDQAVNFDTEYLYCVEMTSMYGVVKSESLRLKTKAVAPQLLVMIGSIRHAGNDSVSLMIRPPLKINGRLESIYVLVKLNGFEVAKEMVHENMAGLDGEQLVEFLSNVTVDGLVADSVYELKTKFCNQASCLISLQTIKFKTLSNERIDFFDAMWRVDKTIVFKWNFKKVSTRSIRFQLRCVNLGGIVMYDGYEAGFEFRTAKSTATYEFELLAIDEQENKLIIDRKNLIVEAQPLEKSLKSDFPLVNIEKLGNESIVLEINWEDFEPNTYGLKPQTFELSVNDKPLYTGQSRHFKQTLSMDACNRLLNASSSVQIRLKSTLNKNIYLAQPVTIPFTCSSTKQSNKSLLFIFLAVAILLFTFTIFAASIWCVNKCRSSNGEQSFSSSTLSINSSLQNLFMQANNSFLSLASNSINHNPVLEKSTI